MCRSMWPVLLCRMTDRQQKPILLPQLELPIRRKPRTSNADVSDEVIARLPNKLEAIKLAQTVSGLEDKEICAGLGIDPGQWSRIKHGAAHFPTNRETDYYDLVGNEIPLRWLAIQRGYELKRRLSEVEMENEILHARVAELEARYQTIVEFVKATGVTPR